MKRTETGREGVRGRERAGVNTGERQADGEADNANTGNERAGATGTTLSFVVEEARSEVEADPCTCTEERAQG